MIAGEDKTELLYYEEEGEGPELIFLHGLMGSCQNWRSIRHRLAKRYRLVCMDLPNHGQSPRQDPFTISSMAHAVLRTAEALNLERPVVVGHSMGGRVAMWLASEFPEKFSGFVSVDMGVKTFPPVHLFVLRACKALPLGQLKTRKALEKELARWLPFGETCDFLLRNVERDAEERFFWRVPLDTLIRGYQTVNVMPKLPRTYQGPCLFLAGGESSLKIDREWALIQEQFPQAELKVIPGASHLVQEDAPEQLLADLVAWHDARIGNQATVLLGNAEEK